MKVDREESDLIRGPAAEGCEAATRSLEFLKLVRMKGKPIPRALRVRVFL